MVPRVLPLKWTVQHSWFWCRANIVDLKALAGRTSCFRSVLSRVKGHRFFVLALVSVTMTGFIICPRRSSQKMLRLSSYLVSSQSCVVQKRDICSITIISIFRIHPVAFHHENRSRLEENVCFWDQHFTVFQSLRKTERFVEKTNQTHEKYSLLRSFWYQSQRLTHNDLRERYDERSDFAFVCGQTQIPCIC